MKTKLVLDSLQNEETVGDDIFVHVSSLNGIEITQGDAVEYQEGRR